MSSFTGGSPPFSLTNDELYRLWQAATQATAPVIITPPPPPPPPSPTTGWPIAGFHCEEIPWVSTNSQSPRVFQIGAVERMIVRFRVPNVVSESVGNISYAEWGRGCSHVAILSQTPGDFDETLALARNALTGGLNGMLNIKVGWVPQNYVALLYPDRYYYLNIRNQNAPVGTTWPIAIGLAIPAGT